MWGTAMARPNTARARGALIVGAVIGGLLTGVGPAQAQAPLPAVVTDRCPNAHALPGTAPPRALGVASVCIVNRIRATRRLPALRMNAQLNRFAMGFTGRMVRQRFFSHDVPGGPTFTQRARSSAYARAAQRHSMGENLAWATAENATPAGIVAAWMGSPGHRANILRRNFREIGVGVIPAAPAPGWQHHSPATYVHAFGWRGRR